MRKKRVSPIENAVLLVLRDSSGPNPKRAVIFVVFGTNQTVILLSPAAFV
jgi:hypothetical protein